MEQSIGKRWSRPLIVAATFLMIAASILTISAAQADAWTHHGCKYKGTSPTIDYKFVNVSDRNETAIETAQANWDLTDSPGYFRPDNFWRDSNIDIFDGNFATNNAWAWVSLRCRNNGNYRSNEVDLTINESTTGAGLLTEEELSIVVVHELGHAYGLDHTNLTCATGPSVMRQGQAKFACAGTAPWNDDVDGVNERY